MITWGADEIIPDVPAAGQAAAGNPWWYGPLASAVGSVAGNLTSGLFNSLFGSGQPEVKQYSQAPLTGAGFDYQAALRRYLGG